MSNTDASGTAGPPGVIIPLPRASAPADPTSNVVDSTAISMSITSVARLLSIQRELLHSTSDRPEAARLLEEMGRIVSPLVPQPDGTATPIASDPISQVLGNPDILVHGLLFFSKTGLAIISRVSKRWKSVLDGVEDKLWAGIAHREVPLLFSAIKGKSGRQWRDFLKRRFVTSIPRHIRQPESSHANLEKYAFELEFSVIAGRRDHAAPVRVEDYYQYVPFRFLLSASPKEGGGVILRNDNAEDARRLKTVAKTALTNSPHILGESEDDGIIAQEWKLRVTNKETLKSAFLLKMKEDRIFRYDKETREGVAFRIQEDDPLADFLIRTSDDDGYAIPYIGKGGCRKLSTNNEIYSSFESFSVSNEEVNFHMTFFFIDPQKDDYKYDDLAFLLANLCWGYY